MLYKGIGQSFTDVDAKAGIVTGFFSAFNILDSDGDVIPKGAFTKTIAERGPVGSKRIKHVIDHDLTKVAAVILELEETDFGLRYASKAGRHTLGQDFLKMAEDGIITEHSFGYKVVKSHKAEFQGEKANYLTELQMWEGSSMQAWGANAFTPVTGVKSLEDVMGLFYKLEKALKTGTYSDEAFIQIEAQYKQLSEYIKTTLPGDSTEAETTKPEEGKDAGKIIVGTFKKALENGRSR